MYFLRTGLLALLAAALAIHAVAQTGEARSNVAGPARFDVASIKPAYHSPGREGGNRNRIEHTPTSLTMWNVSISECVQWAYDVAPFQIASDDASGVNSENYDILAKTETPVDVSQMRAMLQQLLTERFELRLHRESRMLPVYKLVVAKNGPRLPAAKSESFRPVPQTRESLPQILDDGFLFAGVSMDDFAQMLSQLRGIALLVINDTEVPGTFDIMLRYALVPVREGDTQAIMGLLQRQLGLRLVSAKAPNEALVIDHVAKPSPN